MKNCFCKTELDLHKTLQCAWGQAVRRVQQCPSLHISAYWKMINRKARKGKCLKTVIAVIAAAAVAAAAVATVVALLVK